MIIAVMKDELYPVLFPSKGPTGDGFVTLTAEELARVEACFGEWNAVQEMLFERYQTTRP
jgi:hypothetical protein